MTGALPPGPGLPVKPIATLFVMMFANAIVTTTPFPFLPFMVRDFGFEPKDVGTQVRHKLNRHEDGVLDGVNVTMQQQYPNATRSPPVLCRLLGPVRGRRVT